MLLVGVDLGVENAKSRIVVSTVILGQIGDIEILHHHFIQLPEGTNEIFQRHLGGSDVVVALAPRTKVRVGTGDRDEPLNGIL